MILGRPETIIVVAPDLAPFYEFVKVRQESQFGDLVVLLDRRAGERRQVGYDVSGERRRCDRRTVASEAARALLAVLGFTILHREGERYTA